MAEALYRKYRPQVFEDVIGQEHIERTIKNAILQDKVSHAYLFCGPRGTGKTTTARLLAKALLCEKGPTPEPDGTCPQCLAIANGTHPDVYELDAASRTGVENVREEIIGRVQFAPTLGRYKIYIIDEVHMLSTAAFNALLKTLEEPPSHVVFILCTTDPQKVPETIHSRCQRFDFHRISAEAIVSRLGAICIAEGVEFDGDALDLIAQRAEGGMRDALTSLEQLIAFGEGKVTLESAERLLGSLDANDMAEIVGAIGRRDVAQCFTWTADYVETGSDLAQFVRDLAQHMRDMYVLSLSDSDTVLEVSEVVRRELVLEMQYFGVDRLTRMLEILGSLSAEMRTASNPRLSFEIALTRMVRPDSDLTLESLAERVEALEARLSQATEAAGTLPPSPQASPAPATASQGAPGPSQQAQAAAAQTMPQTPTQTTAAQPPSPAPQGKSLPRTSAPAQEGPPRTAPTPLQERASRPAPRTAQAPMASTGALEPESFENPAALQRVWQAALKTVKKNKAAYGVLFSNVRTTYNREGQEVVIEFPAENMFAYSAVQKPEVIAEVSEAFQQAAGRPVPFRFTQAPQPDEKAPAAPPLQAAVMPPMPPAQPVPPQPTPATATAQPATSPDADPVHETTAEGPQQLAATADEAAPLAAATPEGPTMPGRNNAAAPSAPAAPDSANAPVPATDSTDAPAAAVPAPDSNPAPAAAAPAAPGAVDAPESDMKSILAETYGKEIVFKMVEDEGQKE